MDIVKKDYTKEEKIKLLEGLKNRKVSVLEYCEVVGISDVTLYKWRKELSEGRLKDSDAGRPSEKRKRPEEMGPVASLEFNIIQESEAKQMAIQQRFGRFMELKENLISRLRELRKSQAITFTAPQEKKEVMAIHHACYSAIRKAGLPFRVNYSKSKGLFVVIHDFKEAKASKNGAQP